MNSYEQLLSRVRLVRNKWRMQQVLKGVSLFLASTIALLILGVWGADLFGFRPAAVWLMRVATGAAAVFVALRFLVFPLRRRISDVQIAQFVEERYPSLQDRLISAVEFGPDNAREMGMIDLLVRDALEKTGRLDFSVFVDRRRVTVYGAVGLASFLILFVLLNWGPSFFPYGFNRLYVPWTEASISSPLMIQLSPGNVQVAKGADQLVGAQLVGFDSPDVQLMMQPEGSSVWSPVAMEPEPRGSGFRYLLVDMQGSTRYYVEAKGIRSQSYVISVVDLPRVEQIDLSYEFPPYTGMEPQKVENEGDISALKGSKVGLLVRLNQPASSARLVFDDETTMELTSSGGKQFQGVLNLRRSGSYVVQLTNPGAKPYAASSEYGIEAIDDMPPKVVISKPMKDVRATNVEEVFSEVKAEDDIGVAGVQLHYSVNGGDEKTLTLHKGRSDPQVTAGHTFFLEEFGLQPGDVISYYGRASDNNNVTGPGTSASDIYFIQVRPFDQTYRQSQQGGAPGGGSEAQENLSKQQKEIISATFKLIRDKKQLDPKEYSESLKSLALVQGRLQAQAQGVVDRMQRRGASEVNDQFGDLTKYLKGAIEAMERAAVHLGSQKADDALPEEQKALQQLMRAESLFREIQVSFGSQGGGGGSQSSAEDLADLFELELNKLKNQYETVQRGEQQARDEHLDEALQRLKELAQRQQQLNERNRMLGKSGGSSSSSSGGSGGQQQELMSEAERLQRQLQRLSRERSSPELNRVSSQLERAIEEMKKSLSQQRGSQQSSAQGLRALEQLEEAKRLLSRGLERGLNEGLEQAAEESKKLVQEQQRIQQGVDELAGEKAQNGGGKPAAQRKEDLIARKQVLADRVRNLSGKINDLSRQAQKGRRETSSKLNEASAGIREKRLPERILSGNPLIAGEFYDQLKGREDLIRSGLDELSKQLEGARSSVGQSQEGKLEDALNKTRELAEGLESMQQKMGARQQGAQGRDSRQGQRQQSGERGEQGQAGRQGQEGAQGREAAQGRTGEQGQQGQEGRGAAAGPRGEQGQNPGQNPQNAAGGVPDRDARGFTRNAFGPPIGTGGYTDEDLRQLRRETEQRRMDAEELRRLLDQNPTQQKNLDRVIQSLRGADSFDAAAQVARLKSAIDHLRQVELDLSRELGQLTQKDKYFYADDNEAPLRYKKLVEEYYKALARSKK